ncbi:MAG TPA: MFS transporter [Xanthomonadaceae bacterium]|nr:MFS transporter [Xanthomonadaceae bacterium]
MIAVDWGTSSLRAYLLDADGTVLEQRRSDQGVLASAGRFAETLGELVGEWPGHVLLCGMVGSRNGWIELPYLPCPVGADELAAAMRRHQDPRLPGRELWFVPGVATDAERGTPDVMRGEETQVVGLISALGAGGHSVCLPGTHSKWARLEQGRIGGFVTVMTGELYALLRQHSLLGRLMSGDDAEFHPQAFIRGVERSGEAGGLLHHLFGTRTLGLFERLPGESLASYLSGLLIGHEIRDRQPIGGTVHLVGSHGLAQRYAEALGLLGIGSMRHPENLAATGLHRLARVRGLALG